MGEACREVMRLREELSKLEEQVKEAAKRRSWKHRAAAMKERATAGRHQISEASWLGDLQDFFTPRSQHLDEGDDSAAVSAEPSSLNGTDVDAAAAALLAGDNDRQISSDTARSALDSQDDEADPDTARSVADSEVEVEVTFADMEK